VGGDDVAAHDDRDIQESLRLPVARPLGEVRDAWTKSNYGTYFWNSTIVVVIAVLLVTVVGAMAAHCLARYTFRGNRLVRFAILTGLVLPPQLVILALFQILLDIHLYNTLTGLILVYVARTSLSPSTSSKGSSRRFRRTCSTPREWTAIPISRSSGA
jgi:ABC-type glycerol-3-phosphate transport system permease component